ncbi:MAG: hypothetical protein ABR866_01735 [Candidatus Korobacteraceae bacterium]|jgi:hypothetical protein
MELARGFSLDCVLDALLKKDKDQLACFVERRYIDRFFSPIEELHRLSISQVVLPKDTPGWGEPIRPFGFAVISLCCLFIECFESYRRGIPTTSHQDWKKISKDYPPIPKTFTEPAGAAFEDVFKKFFSDYTANFDALDGDDFYKNIRCGLLHQAQTRNGWVIKVHHPDESESSRTTKVLDQKKQIVYRDAFVFQLKLVFMDYVAGLHNSTCPEWENVISKIWWIA